MDADLKKILKAVVLEMRHELEGYYDNAGRWHPGDLETRLAEIGVRKDRASVPVDELGRLIDQDVRARKIVDAFIDVREQAGVDRAEAVAEYVRESAYTWANRLVALRCMEARELLDDEVIVGREAYGGRSLVHHRLAQSSPELCAGEDDGRFAVLAHVFAERAKTLPMLFDPDSPSIALRPSPAALKNCLAWLSGTQKVRSQEPATDAVFAAPDALGWAYQYWNTEEKDRVFEMVRTKKGAKIEGADIIPATQLYTEDYMVKFLVQNSLGATWMGMHPESKLFEGWEYYVRDADRAPATKKPLQQITLLDPACGSGHFLIEAFDMFYNMYEEEGVLSGPEEICKSILGNNLFGIDIDERAVQIAEASLWMKAEERSMHFSGETTNLVAATSSHLKGDSWERFLRTLQKEPSVVRVLRKFATAIEHIDELGSLSRPAEDLKEIINAEHRLWEEQVRSETEANFLFPEMVADALAGQLPFDEISDEQFGHRMMNRALMAIDGFTKDARENGEFNDQLIGKEAKTGFRLFDLLSAAYDIVVANPPYMGSRKMGSTVKSHIGRCFPDSKRDIYAAFIERNLSIAKEQGFVAMITLHTWMFLNSYAKLRPNLLAANCIDSIAHLGRHAFSEADPPGNAVMVVFRKSKPTETHQMVAYRLTASRPAAEQASLLKRGIDGTECSIKHDIQQRNLQPIPGQPIVYWIHDAFFELLTSSYRVSSLGGVKQGIATGDNTRHLRFHWETSQRGNWVQYAKGGGYRKWFGLNTHVIDWREDGVIHRENPSAAIRNPDTYFHQGITYTLMARGSLGLRLIDNSVYDVASMSIFPDASRKNWLMAVLNCRLLSYLARVVSQDIKFNTSYVSSLPLPSDLHSNAIAQLAKKCIELKQRFVSKDLTERCFDATNVISHSTTDEYRALKEDLLAVEVLTLEAHIEKLVLDAYGIDGEAVDDALKETGAIPGLLPLLSGYEHPPTEGETVSIEQLRGLELEVIQLDESSLNEVRNRIFDQYRAGFGEVSQDSEDESAHDDDDSDDDGEGVAETQRMPIPPEFLLEHICNDVQLHPVSVFLILREGIPQTGLYCRPRRLARAFDSLSVRIMMLLGHLWDTRSPVIDQFHAMRDADGIVALTEVNVAKEVTLQSRLSESFSSTDDYRLSGLSEVVGKSIEDWLTADFFPHHITQFRKRPIAWQLQSSSFTSRKSPAFACLVYYHRVDVDAIPKIRMQYIGPLKLRFETEARGISSTPVTSRTDNQARRLVELEETITELLAFDDTLATIAKSGFGPDKLLPNFRQYAFDDAMLSMKACWLQRLAVVLKQSPFEEDANEVRRASPLDDWQDQASKTGLHPELAGWIGEAFSHVSNFCSQVGPKAPDAEHMPEDPTAADLAESIQRQTTTMQTNSMRLACGVWWGKFDAAVLAPIRERIKTLKAEQKELNAAIKEDRQPVMVAEQVLEGSAEDGVSVVTRVANDMPLFGNDQSFEQTTELTKAAMTARLKEVKAKIKKFTEEMDSKAGKAQAIRDSIQAWRLPDPIPDSLDFRPSSPTRPPLFDQVSSLDERRAPPKTIAEFIAQESLYAPDINDGVRVNIAPLQKAGVLAADVLAAKDVDKAIADRAEWRADERRWVREGKLPQPGWWKVGMDEGGGMKDEETDSSSAPTDGVAGKQFVSDGKDDQ
jgi:hypothetical protein